MAKQQSVTALIIDDRGVCKLRVLPGTGLDDTLRSIVGGWLEIISGSYWHAYVDEEGRMKDRAINNRASWVAKEAGWRGNQWLCGTVVFLGETGKGDGREGSVPRSILNLIDGRWYPETDQNDPAMSFDQANSLVRHDNGSPVWEGLGPNGSER